MKKLLLISMLATTGIFLSCGEDDTPSTDNGFTYDGDFYATTIAYIQDYGENDNGSFDVDLVFSSKTVDFDAESTSDLSFIYLDLNTSMRGVLEAGTYNYGEDRDEFVMVDAAVAVNLSSDSEGETISGTALEITAGSVTITQNGSSYTAVYTLTAEGGAVITGAHTGTLTVAPVN